MKNEDALKASFKELGEEALLLLAFQDAKEYRVIHGQVMIERLTDSPLEKNLNKYKLLLKKHRIYFDLKMDLYLCLSLMSEKLSSALRTLNRIRNKLSHEKKPEISQDEMKRSNTGFYKEPMFQKALEFTYEKGIRTL